jgi:hypothetical protein
MLAPHPRLHVAAIAANVRTYVRTYVRTLARPDALPPLRGALRTRPPGQSPRGVLKRYSGVLKRYSGVLKRYSGVLRGTQGYSSGTQGSQAVLQGASDQSFGRLQRPRRLGEGVAGQDRRRLRRRRRRRRDDDCGARRCRDGRGRDARIACSAARWRRGLRRHSVAVTHRRAKPSPLPRGQPRQDGCPWATVRQALRCDARSMDRVNGMRRTGML